MAIPSTLLLLILSLILATSTSDDPDRSLTYIVHVSNAHKPSIFTSHHHWYSSILRSLPDPSPHILYTYSLSARGFSAANLSSASASHLRRTPGVLSVVPDRPNFLHTTRTPRFLGLTESFGLWPNSDYADDVIVGVLDTGIWPEIRSFSDDDLSPVPSSWKGACETGPEFPSCNKKIIGARAFYKGYEAARGKMDEEKESKSPRDTEGHGTHTASTSAGGVVSNASFYQYARGVARGMANKARIAAYKICWKSGCYDSDILAAMDQAVADGVNVISLSVGANGYAPQYDRDSIAIGAFGAAEHGVVVSCSAGNSGPNPYTAVNIAPWILTVGASTIDREFPADVVLGDGRILGGVSLYSGEIDDLIGDKLPLVYAGDCGSRYCYPGFLDSAKVEGKIVICDRGGNARVEKGSAVKMAGGVAMILANTAESGEELIADSHLIPGTMVGQIAGDKIKNYVKSEANPAATINFRGTVIGSSPPAPKVAAFSSRGPNRLTSEILKPDVIAPGVNILAGWTGSNGPTDLEIDPRRVEFNIISGTSMSCPHVSGLVALLRKTYPDWSPAEIKSALMTTAYNSDNSGGKFIDLASGEESSPFVHGAGHVDPNRALNPGLVYDITTKDYVAFLCSIGYSSQQIQVFSRETTAAECTVDELTNPGNLNYPSFSVVFNSFRDVIKNTRVVKNVGVTDAVYQVTVTAPPEVVISVSPSRLEFNAESKALSYEVTFSSAGLQKCGNGRLLTSFGSIEWSDGSHVVRSPVAIRWPERCLMSI